MCIQLLLDHSSIDSSSSPRCAVSTKTKKKLFLRYLSSSKSQPHSLMAVCSQNWHNANHDLVRNTSILATPKRSDSCSLFPSLTCRNTPVKALWPFLSLKNFNARSWWLCSSQRSWFNGARLALVCEYKIYFDMIPPLLSILSFILNIIKKNHSSKYMDSASLWDLLTSQSWMSFPKSGYEPNLWLAKRMSQKLILKPL